MANIFRCGKRLGSDSEQTELTWMAKVFTLKVKVYYEETAEFTGEDIAKDVRNRLYDLDGIVDVQVWVEHTEHD